MVPDTSHGLHAAPATRDGNASRTLYLHIGAPKTGTSAIQAFMSLNRKAFEKTTGIRYPESDTDQRAIKGKPTAGNGAQIARHLRANKTSSLKHATSLLKDELSSGRRSTLISSEGFWSVGAERMADFVEAARSRADVKIICYARPQVRHVESAYLQALGNRGLKGDVADFFAQQSAKFLVGSKVQALQGIVGPENLIVRKYDRTSMVGGDVVDDFLATLGAAWSEDFRRPPEVNATLDTEHYLFSRVAGEVGESGGKRAMRDLASLPAVEALYRDAEPIRHFPIMQPETARAVRDFYREDNELLDALLPEHGFRFNQANETAVSLCEERASQPPSGLSRLEVMLLSRVVQLEARLDEVMSACIPEKKGGGKKKDRSGEAAFAAIN